VQDPSRKGTNNRDHESRHSHSHGPSLARAGTRHRSRLAISFLLIATFFLVEAIAGFITNSLALLSDAGHMLTDVIGLGMALTAIELATRHEQRVKENGRSSRHTFGLYRLEILAAFVNCFLLIGIAAYIFIEAARRLFDKPEVLGTPMLVVAILGFIVNLVAFFLLREGAKESLNVEGAYLEVLADSIGSAGVIIAAILLQVFGWTWVDPVIAAAIGLWILPRTWHLGRQAVRILIQSAPPHLNLQELQTDLAGLPGVVDVHDLHVWTLTSEMHTVSAHLVITENIDPHSVLDQARNLLTRNYEIAHSTFQVEPDTHTGCADLHW